MTGLDKIKERIEAEARDTAQEELRKAGDEADAILGQASADVEKTKADRAQKSQAAVASYRERIASAIDIQRRNKILAAKQQIIGEVLKEAEEQVASLDDTEYFALIEHLIENCVHAEEGELFLSEKDLSRAPSDFGEKAAEIAKAHGGSLTLSKKPADIKNGCVLVYGGIEENCTLDAVFSAKKEELSDLAVKILFS